MNISSEQFEKNMQQAEKAIRQILPDSTVKRFRASTSSPDRENVCHPAHDKDKRCTPAIRVCDDGKYCADIFDTQPRDASQNPLGGPPVYHEGAEAFDTPKKAFEKARENAGWSK